MNTSKINLNKKLKLKTENRKFKYLETRKYLLLDTDCINLEELMGKNSNSASEPQNIPTILHTVRRLFTGTLNVRQ